MLHLSYILFLQQHIVVFFIYIRLLQDTCLFSDVAARLGSGTYRMPARQFLQELFLDSPFDAVSFFMTYVSMCRFSYNRMTHDCQQFMSALF